MRGGLGTDGPTQGFEEFSSPLPPRFRLVERTQTFSTTLEVRWMALSLTPWQSSRASDMHTQRCGDEGAGQDLGGEESRAAIDSLLRVMEQYPY